MVLTRKINMRPGAPDLLTMFRSSFAGTQTSPKLRRELVFDARIFMYIMATLKIFAR